MVITTSVIITVCLWFIGYTGIDMAVYVGLDIGGTKLMVAAADESGKMLRRVMKPTPLALQEGLDLLHGMIAEAAAGEPIAGMGAAIGGPLDWRTGVVSPLHQPQWRDVPLRAMMEARWGCPFTVDVDANVAALGEYHADGEALDPMLYLTVSTGMGGGLVTGGQLYRGASGAHPEVAHQSIPYRCANPDGLVCECGLPDCLEALVSGNGIRRIYRRPAEELDAAQWDEVAYNLGQGLRNLAVILAPAVIVLGGGVAVGGGALFIQAVERVMRAHLRLVPAPKVKLSSLGYDTALIGALVVARVGLG
jgi:predicted NBD/HSP70 family sugar kinase